MRPDGRDSSCCLHVRCQLYVALAGQLALGRGHSEAADKVTFLATCNQEPTARTPHVNAAPKSTSIRWSGMATKCAKRRRRRPPRANPCVGSLGDGWVGGRGGRGRARTARRRRSRRRPRRRFGALCGARWEDSNSESGVARASNLGWTIVVGNTWLFVGVLPNVKPTNSLSPTPHVLRTFHKTQPERATQTGHTGQTAGYFSGVWRECVTCIQSSVS